MAGVKGKSGGPRPGKAGRCGPTPPGEKRVKVIAGVLPDTFAKIRAEAAKSEKGRAATPSGFSAKILDGWARRPSRKKVEIPPPYSTRRVQITVWVLPATKIAIFSAGVGAVTTGGKEKGLNSVAGEILDQWAIASQTRQDRHQAAIDG